MEAFRYEFAVCLFPRIDYMSSMFLQVHTVKQADKKSESSLGVWGGEEGGSRGPGSRGPLRFILFVGSGSRLIWDDWGIKACQKRDLGAFWFRRYLVKKLRTLDLVRVHCGSIKDGVFGSP